AQCGAHLVRHLDAVAEALPQKRWPADLRRVLIDAKVSSEQAAVAGLPSVPEAVARPIRSRYRTALNHAFVSLPPGPPPRRRHTGDFSHAQREAWNLAARMLRHEEQVLRLLGDTRVPFTNNEAERSIRMAKLHDCDDARAGARVA
ncbi:MAG: IS66 family transposase, partial [Nocardioidaceae bacterium]